MEYKDTILLDVTKTEAEKGCVKIISEGGLAYPLRFQVPEGVTEGTSYEIENADYQDGEEVVRKPLYITVRIVDDPETDDEGDGSRGKAGNKKKLSRKKKVIIGIIALLLIAAAVAVVLLIVG